MNITNRLYTYPVLSDEKNDYQKSRFDVDVKQYMNGINTIVLEFNIDMTNAELGQLIRDGKAEYVIHLEGSSTAFRISLHSSTNYIKYEIPIGRVNGKLEMVAFIVSREDITHFSSVDLDDDYEGLKFSISKSSILGYQNLPPLEITKDFEEFSNASSIFLVYKRLTEEDKPIEIGLDSHKIRIGLGSAEYNVFAKFSNKVELQPVFHSMLILPTLVYVFEELRQEGGIDNYSSREWFLSLEKSYSKRGVDFLGEIQDSEKPSIELAQEAMELPLNKAFSQIANIYENMDEEDL